MNELKQVVYSIKRYIELEKNCGISEAFSTKPSYTQNTDNAKTTQNMGLDYVRQEVANCKKCDLYKTRLNVVFGDGSITAKVVFVGEAPGSEEDKRGLPFVGRAGNLLTECLQKAGLERKNVYICNVLKCRPPDNRNPLPNEIAQCQGFLRRQLEMINPKVICTLGKFSAQLLLDQPVFITKIRGRVYSFQNSILIPTMHPAYLLRNPNDIKLFIQDIKLVVKKISESNSV